MAAHGFQLSLTDFAFSYVPLLRRLLARTKACSGHSTAQERTHEPQGMRQARQPVMLWNDALILTQSHFGEIGARWYGQHEMQARARNCT